MGVGAGAGAGAASSETISSNGVWQIDFGAGISALCFMTG